jgi:putative FmdB family regulatory protein
MPLYEYLCEECEGIFEQVRFMKEAEEPQPCPVCDTEGRRLMPSTFHAFIMRNGYPRRIPDRGNFWHLGKEVSYLAGKARPGEHPQIKKERRKDPLARQDRTELVEKKVAERRENREQRKAQHARKMEVRNRKKIAKVPKGRLDN